MHKIRSFFPLKQNILYFASEDRYTYINDSHLIDYYFLKTGKQQSKDEQYHPKYFVIIYIYIIATIANATPEYTKEDLIIKAAKEDNVKFFLYYRELEGTELTGLNSLSSALIFAQITVIIHILYIFA